MPVAHTVDISPYGVLLAFVEPVGLLVGSRIVVSLEFADGFVHCLARVVRCERGEDFRSYVGLEFELLSDAEIDEIRRRVDDMQRKHMEPEGAGQT